MIIYNEIFYYSFQVTLCPNILLFIPGHSPCKNQFIHIYTLQVLLEENRKQEQKQWKFKILDMVAIKINKVDKINPFHHNTLLVQIIKTEKSGYERIVTEYGKVNTLILPSRLYPCTATNVKLDFSSKTSFKSSMQKQVDYTLFFYKNVVFPGPG